MVRNAKHRQSGASPIRSKLAWTGAAAAPRAFQYALVDDGALRRRLWANPDENKAEPASLDLEGERSPQARTTIGERKASFKRTEMADPQKCFAAGNSAVAQRIPHRHRTERRNMSASISIAMATFNGEKYLKKQLESLARQTVPPLELVICDDCSSDATVAIITHFASSAPFPVRIYRNEVNLGNSDNFFKAAGLCCGQWIAFCDQDDVWLQNKLARLSLVIDRCPGNELMLVAHTSLVANENLELMEQRSPHFSRDAYVRRADRYAISVIQGFSLVCNAILVKEVDSKWRPIIYNNDKSLHVTSPSHDGWICTVGECSRRHIISLRTTCDLASTQSGQNLPRSARWYFVKKPDYDKSQNWIFLQRRGVAREGDPLLMLIQFNTANTAGL